MSDFVKIPKEAIAELRWALAQGLHALGEVERSQQLFELLEMHGPLSAELKSAMPVTAFASMGDLSRFAEALIWLDSAEELEA